MSRIGKYFRPLEIERLHEGLFDLGQISTKIQVPFEAKRLANPRLLWLNERWFLERGFDTADPVEQRRLSDWLLDEFGFAVPGADDPQERFVDESRTFHADRYGSNDSLSTHGGSGRVGISGRFQAKGIGLTPLAGEATDWVHSHGCLSLEEAIREAIYSEIAHEEFPFGAVPVLAVIGMGLHFSWPPPNKDPNRTDMHRAILIRPVVLRPAHAQRAPRFLKSVIGLANSQIDDVQRTRAVVQSWLSGADVGADSPPPLVEFVSRMAEQIAFGQAHRMFNGGYFSSNIAIDGALLDFGAMRSLKNWCHVKVLDHVVGFGEETKFIKEIIASLCFYLNKFGSIGSPRVSPDKAFSTAMEVYRRVFERECMRLFSLDGEADSTPIQAIRARLKEYFSLQQTTTNSYRHGNIKMSSWLYDVFERSAPEDSPESKTMSAICDDLMKLELSEAEKKSLIDRSYLTAVRLLMPRKEIELERLSATLHSTLNLCGRVLPDPLDVERKIAEITGKSRRYWKNAPRDLAVRAQIYEKGCTALLGYDATPDSSIAWLEGPRISRRYRFFEYWLEEADLRGLDLATTPTRWSAKVQLTFDSDRGNWIANFNMRSIPLPRPITNYAVPEWRNRPRIHDPQFTDRNGFSHA